MKDTTKREVPKDINDVLLNKFWLSVDILYNPKAISYEDVTELEFQINVLIWKIFWRRNIDKNNYLTLSMKYLLDDEYMKKLDKETEDNKKLWIK